jgi:hypothetical protein
MLIMSTGTGSIRVSHMARISGTSNTRHYVSNLAPISADQAGAALWLLQRSNQCQWRA